MEQMKQNRFKLILPVLGTALLLLLLLSGLFDIGVKSEYSRDANGNFRTNNVRRAQKEIPFTIILPTYLPGYMGTNYPYQIVGHVADNTQPEVGIMIAYVKDEIGIYISEQNAIYIATPAAESDSVYLDIFDIKVLFQKPKTGVSSDITGRLLFDWNQNGLTFRVETIFTSEEDANKIIESMIVQIKQ
jgi:hypothetical protein